MTLIDVMTLHNYYPIILIDFMRLLFFKFLLVLLMKMTCEKKHRLTSLGCRDLETYLLSCILCFVRSSAEARTQVLLIKTKQAHINFHKVGELCSEECKENAQASQPAPI